MTPWSNTPVCVCVCVCVCVNFKQAWVTGLKLGLSDWVTGHNLDLSDSTVGRTHSERRGHAALELRQFGSRSRRYLLVWRWGSYIRNAIAWTYVCVAYPQNRGISFFSGVFIKIYWCVCDVPPKKFLKNKNEFLLVDMSKHYVFKLIENLLFWEFRLQMWKSRCKVYRKHISVSARLVKLCMLIGIAYSEMFLGKRMYTVAMVHGDAQTGVNGIIFFITVHWECVALFGQAPLVIILVKTQTLWGLEVSMSLGTMRAGWGRYCGTLWSHNTGSRQVVESQRDS
jgi:hypothetical protein